ncbi:MAG: phage tail assembly chaperone [Sphingomonas sp.]|nr:phage tail assembly chaperone [Sphingomonas sp.]
MFFGEAAAKLAGLAGALFGWSPDIFWRATPAELASVVAALAGDAAPPPPDRAAIAALMEAFPDG